MASQYKLSVCPHDTAKNLIGWYTFNSYLQRHLGVGISFEAQENFLVERQKVLADEYHIVYANPASALCFAREKHFAAVARPVGICDEVIVVCRPGMSMPDTPRIASATDELIVHALGLKVVESCAIDVDKASFIFTGNHLGAAKAVMRGEADIGFVYNETWNGLSDLTRSELQVLGISAEGLAFHCFMVAPAWDEKREEVRGLLCGMDRDAAGRRILDDLNFSALEPVAADAIEQLGKLVGS